MDGKQTVPRTEMAAVIRALLAITATGHSVTKGYNEGKQHTLQSLLVTDWEDLWEQAEAIADRGVTIHVKK
eukprot:2487782-Karenia_brevis.AAC.1